VPLLGDLNGLDETVGVATESVKKPSVDGVPASTLPSPTSTRCAATRSDDPGDALVDRLDPRGRPRRRRGGDPHGAR